MKYIIHEMRERDTADKWHYSVSEREGKKRHYHCTVAVAVLEPRRFPHDVDTPRKRAAFLRGRASMAAELLADRAFRELDLVHR